jgi:hypothetical protein
MTSIPWIGVLLVGAVAAVSALKSWRRRTDKTELGHVSERWLSERRSSDPYNAER